MNTQLLQWVYFITLTSLTTIWKSSLTAISHLYNEQVFLTTYTARIRSFHKSLSVKRGLSTLKGWGIPTLDGNWGIYLGQGGTYLGGGGEGYLPWMGVGYLPWSGAYLPWRGVPTLDGGYLPWPGGTYLRWGRGYLGQGGTHPGWGLSTLARGVPTLTKGYLPWGVPTLSRGVPTLAGGNYPGQGGTYPGWGVPTLPGVPTLDGRYLPWTAGYLPWMGGYSTLDGEGGYLPWSGCVSGGTQEAFLVHYFTLYKWDHFPSGNLRALRRYLLPVLRMPRRLHR